MDVLGGISVCIVAAAILAFAARGLGQPALPGYIVAGGVLGPHVGLNVVADEQAIELIAEIGLILLLFLIGLEISLPRLLQAGRTILVTGLLQVPICVALAWFCLGPAAAFTGGRFDRAYLAVVSSLSSTLIVVKLLSDKFELSTFAGRVTLGILVFQDLFAIVFVALQPNLDDLQPASLLRSLVAGAALVGGAASIARFVLPSFFRAIARSSELIVVSAMAWCFLVAAAAGWAGLSKEMGALVGGVVIASLPYGTEVIARIGGVRDFFLTLFFVALGLRIPSPTLGALGFALAVVAFVVASRFIALLPLFARLRLDARTGGVVAVNLSQVSEFALVIFALGGRLGHVSEAASTIVLYALLLGAVLSTYGILYNHTIATGFASVLHRLALRRFFGGERHVAVTDDPRGSGRDVFLLGVSREGLAFIERLEQIGSALKERLVAVDFNPETLDRLECYGVERHYGDISSAETLRHAGLERASVVVSPISDWFLKGTSNRNILQQVRTLAPSARVIVTADSLERAQELYRESADYVLVPPVLTADHLERLLSDTSADAIDDARERQAAEMFQA